MKRIALTILMICFSSLSLLAEEKVKEAPTEGKRGPDRLFMPKGDFSAGAQFSYVDLLSNDSEYLMLVQHLDANGVGKLVKMAAVDGRATNPNLGLGICGEHGGDPTSVEFCHNVGLDYVSCSPFRVPIARLAAAQAAIKNPRK